MWILLKQYKIQATFFYICLKSCKFAVELESHLKAHELGVIINQHMRVAVSMVKTAIICQILAALIYLP